jgi:hypothetical protein
MSYSCCARSSCVPCRVVISPLGGKCKAIPASSCASVYVQPHVSEQLRALGAVACRCAPYEQLRALWVLFGRSISWTAMTCCSSGIVRAFVSPGLKCVTLSGASEAHSVSINPKAESSRWAVAWC